MILYVLEPITTRFFACDKNTAKQFCLLAAVSMCLIFPATVIAQENSNEAYQSADSRLIHDLRKTIAFYPFKADAWQKLGEAYSRAGEFRKAEEAFLSGLGIDSKSPELWNDL